MKIAEELRPDGSTRYRVQHKDVARPGRYTTRRFDAKSDAAEFVRRAKTELKDALAWDDERKGGVSFRGQAGRTFFDYASDFVLAQTDEKESTTLNKESKLRGISRFGDFSLLPMGAISTHDIEMLKRNMSEYRDARGELLKSRTKNGLLAFVFSVIRRAVARNDIPRDVTLGVAKFRVTDAKETCPISVEEFDSIMVHVSEPRRVLFRLLLDSGLRISEALALRPEDIRETKSGIYEVSIYTLDASRGKTRSAQRITTIPVETFKQLDIPESGLLFPMSYDSYSAEWRRAVQRAQSPAHATEFPTLTKTPRIHDLRHSHAAYLLTSCGLNLSLVAERLGHRDIGITQRYYGRLVTEQAHDLGVLIARNIPRGVIV